MDMKQYSAAYRDADAYGGGDSFPGLLLNYDIIFLHEAKRWDSASLICASLPNARLRWMPISSEEWNYHYIRRQSLAAADDEFDNAKVWFRRTGRVNRYIMFDCMRAPRAESAL